jgi:hypothetical protein
MTISYITLFTHRCLIVLLTYFYRLVLLALYPTLPLIPICQLHDTYYTSSTSQPQPEASEYAYS